MYKIHPTCQMKNLEEILLDTFGYTENGAFVDVGAHDGITHSNTWGLAEIGWYGVMIEPIDDLFSKCCRVHHFNNVSVYRCCSGDFDGETKLWLGENPTIDEETVMKSPWGEKYDPDKFIKTTVRRLDSILKDEGFPTEFHVCSIDVEGGELKVLEGFDLNVWKPKLLIIETHDGNEDVKRSFHAKAINDVVGRYPYDVISKDGLNTVWRRHE